MTYPFYDTNAILDLQEQIFNGEKFGIAEVTLQELEDIKTSKFKDDSVKYRARNISRLLDQHWSEFDVWRSKLIFEISGSNDQKIIYLAKEAIKYEHDLIFYSSDINCRLLARKNDLPVGEVNTKERIYTGYKEFTGTAEEINEFVANTDFITNEYLIINNVEDGTTKEMRFDGNIFVALRLPPQKFLKAKNSLQRCAIDLLLNPNITICGILGSYGSGKSFLSMQMAKYLVCDKGYQSKILGIREPHGEGKEIGFLPGEFSNKTEYFFAPLMQQLDGGEFELESMKQRGILEEIIPYYMKGMTYNDTIMLVDEAEDLTEKQLRLIGTRVGDNSRIFFSGDYKQSLVDTTDSNALVKMCNLFKGNPMFGCIVLSEDVRSETSKLFANLYER